MSGFKMPKIKLGLLLFVLSTLFSGVIWEGIGWIALLYILIKCSNRYGSSNIEIKHSRMYFCLILVIAYVCYQCVALGLDLNSVIRLYGITKTLFAIPIIIIFFDRYAAERDIIVDILPLILLVDWITIFSLITENDIFNLIGGSQNYLGAINILLFGYIFKFMEQESYGKIKTFFMITFVLLVLFSGSRTLMLTTVIMFCGVTLLEKNLNNKIKYLTFCILVIVFGIFVMNAFGITSKLLERSLSVFASLNDDSRIGLQYFAEQQYATYSDLQKLIGSGNNIVLSQMKPVHNVFGEIRLCYGKIGLAFWCIYLFVWCLGILKKGGTNKFYILLVSVIAVLIGQVQPYLTSGYLFQVIMAFVCLQIYYIRISEKL